MIRCVLLEEQGNHNDMVLESNSNKDPEVRKGGVISLQARLLLIFPILTLNKGAVGGGDSKPAVDRQTSHCTPRIHPAVAVAFQPVINQRCFKA
jgi:hypothetical protein